MFRRKKVTPIVIGNSKSILKKTEQMQKKCTKWNFTITYLGGVKYAKDFLAKF